MTTKTMKPALTRIGGGQVHVVARLSDYNPQHVQGKDGSVQIIPVHALFAFSAQDYSELDDSDIWEFRVLQEIGDGKPAVATRLFLCGEDIFTVSAMSKVAL